MGKRVHVVKRQPKYGNSEGFNWKQDEFRILLLVFNCDLSGDEFSDYFDCPLDEYKKALNMVKYAAKHDEEATKKKFDKEGFDYENYLASLNGVGYTKEALLDILQAFYDERDKQSGYIAFSVW